MAGLLTQVIIESTLTLHEKGQKLRSGGTIKY
jgi:hypothetical protein